MQNAHAHKLSSGSSQHEKWVYHDFTATAMIESVDTSVTTQTSSRLQLWSLVQRLRWVHCNKLDLLATFWYHSRLLIHHSLTELVIQITCTVQVELKGIWGRDLSFMIFGSLPSTKRSLFSNHVNGMPKPNNVESHGLQHDMLTFWSGSRSLIMSLQEVNFYLTHPFRTYSE